jgi:CRP-like cAMP-binding protein
MGRSLGDAWDLLPGGDGRTLRLRTLGRYSELLSSRRLGTVANVVVLSSVLAVNMLQVKANMKSKPEHTFNPQVFLQSVGASRRVEEFRKEQAIFSQGDAADSVRYVQKGSVKLTVVNESGKEAVVAIFGPGDFLGEGSMAGQTLRMGTATAISPTTILLIEKDEMLRALHAEHGLSDRFITCMLARNNRGRPDRSALQLD